MPENSGDDVATTLMAPRAWHTVGPDARGHRSEQAMADINVDEIGPVDYLVVGFPADKASFSAKWHPS
jgi:hypothetical protein